MKYMLDTNICIYLIKHEPKNVINKFKSLKLGDVGISSITLAELKYGIYKSQHQKKNQDALDEFILPLEIAAFDDNASDCYGMIRAHLEKKGTPIGPLDFMIAAHAKSLGSILVTNNKKEFNRIPELIIEDWVHKH